MKNLKKKIISIFLVLVMVLTMLPADMGVDTAKAADTTGSLSLTYRYGTDTYIQVNTNLPSTTPLKDFLATDNGCNIDQTANTTHNFGYASMANVDGTIVITFNFGTAFTAGQNWIVGQGSVFGFTDGNTYPLDKNYTFTFDGANWTMTTEEIASTISVEYRYGTGSLIQMNTNLPMDTPCVNFTTDQNGCAIIQSGEQKVGWVGMENVSGTVVLTFHFNNSFVAGQNYVLEKGSIFGFTNGKTYELDEKYTFTYNGSGWTKQIGDVFVPETRTLSFYGVHYTKANLIQVKTSMPLDFANSDFSSTSEGCELKQTGSTQELWYASIETADSAVNGQRLITLRFQNEFKSGEKYILEKGTTIKGADGHYYVLDYTYEFSFDGSNWSMKQVYESFSMTYHYGAAKVIQVYTDLPDNVIGDFLATENGCAIDESGSAHAIGYVHPSVEEKGLMLTFHFNTSYEEGELFVLPAGSIFGFDDGSKYTLDRTYTFEYKGGESWGLVDWIYSNIEGDANGDTNVDSMDLIRLKKVVNKAKDANNQCDLDVNQKYNGVDVHYLRLIILYGSISNLDVLDPLLYMGGENFVTFADLPVDATDTSKIAEFKALGFNTSLLTEDHASISYSVTLDKSETAEIELGEGEQLLELTHTQFTNDGKMIQIQTNLPSDKTYSDFLLGDGDHVLDVVSDNTIGYFQLWKDSSSNIVYFNPMYNSSCDNGDQYILKAGSKLNVDGVYYVLDRTYTFTIQNEYLASIQNLDKAGLNVWIRNYSNQAGYFTDYMTNLLALHKDKIDGYYIIDEPYATTELYEYSKNKYSASEITDSFGNISSDLVPWFNRNYADTYFHINHVPMSSYNHYGTEGDTKAEPAKYATFFDTYVTNILANVSTSNEKKTIGYDYYPFGYAEDEEYLWGLITKTEFYTTGIAPNYLVNMLIPAHKAKANGATFSTCIQTFNNTYKDKTREITTAAEVSFQLYTAMSCGADMFEYFTYNSGSGFEGIMNSDGTGRIYNEVKEANTNAFSFADVINVFDWQGAQVSRGSSTNKNATGIATAQNAGLDLLLSDSTNGVLSSVSSDDDAVVGYYTKGTQAGYMVANYNDPKVVTTNNTVTLKFDGCTKARVYTAVDGKLTSEVVTLTNNSYTHEVAPGGAFFIIPVNAQ